MENNPKKNNEIYIYIYIYIYIHTHTGIYIAEAACVVSTVKTSKGVWDEMQPCVSARILTGVALTITLGPIAWCPANQPWPESSVFTRAHGPAKKEEPVEQNASR